jgi:hypothetical protein
MLMTGFPVLIILLDLTAKITKAAAICFDL